jgi:hypothetical protein
MLMTALDRLTSLKQELDGLPTEPWTNVESWIAKATPVIRRDWSDHFTDFKQAAATPDWTAALPVPFGRNEAEFRANIARKTVVETTSNRGIANSAKDKLLKFIDGLISIAEPTAPIPAPKPRRSKKLRQRALVGRVATQMSVQPPFRILFLAANPKDTEPLRLDEEIRTIEERLRLSKHSFLFEIRQAWAVRVKDLQEVLLRHDPHIVHFSGHGSDCGEVVLENAQGDSQPVEPTALSDLFKVLKESSIRGVVLNSCGSLSQGKAIVKHIEFVVGMSDEIGDESAIAFAASFYQSLGYGKSVKTSFELGRNQIQLEGFAEENLPKLLARRGTDPKDIVLVDAPVRPTT